VINLTWPLAVINLTPGSSCCASATAAAAFFIAEYEHAAAAAAAALSSALAVSNATLPNFNRREQRREPNYDWLVPCTPCSWNSPQVHRRLLLPLPLLLLLLLLPPPSPLSCCCFA
jgi:hypothetical protein